MALIENCQRHLAQALVVLLCEFLCANIINPMYIQLLREMVPPPSQNTVGVCNQITLLILYYGISWLVTLLTVNDAPIQVPYIFLSFC